MFARKVWSQGFFLLDNRNHDVSQIDISNKRYSHSVQYFYCSIQVVLDNIRVDRIHHLSDVLYHSTTPVKPQRIPANATALHLLSDVKCRKTSDCQVVYTINRKSPNYTQIEMRNMNYSGWKVPTCFYGGISFYEKDLEVLSLCDNYTYLENKIFQVPEKKTSLLFQNNTRKPIVPYVSATNSIKLVLYNDSSASVNVMLTFSSVQCRGVFFSPCQKYILEFRKHAVIPRGVGVKESGNVVHYGTSGKNNSCIVYQVGHRYGYSARYYTGDSLFFLNYIFIRGCSVKHQLRAVSEQVCEVHMNFTHVVPRVEYNDGASSYRGDSLSYTGDSLDFVHKIENDHEEKCEQKTYKRYSFETKINLSTHLGSVFLFNTKVNLRSTFSDLGSNHANKDLLFTNIGPYSESVSNIRFQQTTCTSSKLMQVKHPEGSLDMSSPNNDTICLRDSIGPYSGGQWFLTISLLGAYNWSNCGFGHMKISTYLCVHSDEYMAVGINRYMNLPACDNIFIGSGVDSRHEGSPGSGALFWTSELSTLTLRTQTATWHLPGNVMDALIILNGDNCCKGPSCWLQYMWVRKEPDLVDFFRELKEEDIRFENIRRKVAAGYEAPPAATWQEANNKCKDDGEHLPSMVSYRDVQKLMLFLYKVSGYFLVTDLFIGIHKQVCVVKCPISFDWVLNFIRNSNLVPICTLSVSCSIDISHSAKFNNLEVDRQKASWNSDVGATFFSATTFGTSLCGVWNFFRCL